MERGAVMLIGNTEDRPEAMIIQEFIRLAGDGEARVVVLGDRGEQGAQTAEAYGQLLSQAGARCVETVGSSEQNRRLEQATGIWMIQDAGDKDMLARNDPLAAILHKRYASRAVIADSMSMAVVAPAEQLTSLKGGSGTQSEGFDLMNGLRLLPVQGLYRSRAQSGRGTSLASAVMRNPGALWLDIDPHTAAVIRDGKLAVVGQGSVLVIDVGDAPLHHHDRLNNDGCFLLDHVRLHMLSGNCGFDLLRRAIIQAPLVAGTVGA